MLAQVFTTALRLHPAFTDRLIYSLFDCKTVLSPSATYIVDYPLIRLGVSKFISTFLVFFFSAALHELIIATPFRYIALHAFAGMMFQAPLIYITKVIDRRFENAVLGNCFFWMVFCVLGQPMGVLMYNYDLWRLENTVPVVAAVCTAAVNGVC